MANLLHRWGLSYIEEECLHCSPAAKHSLYPTSQQMLHPEFSVPEVPFRGKYVSFDLISKNVKPQPCPVNMGHNICFFRITVEAKVKAGTLLGTSL